MLPLWHKTTFNLPRDAASTAPLCFFVQLGTGFISRRLTYHVGQATSAHGMHEKLQLSPTTNLVKSITAHVKTMYTRRA